MFEDLIIDGYRYSDLSFFLPSGLDQETRDSIEKGGAVAGLRLRDYVLDGGRLGIDIGESNEAPNTSETWYEAQCSTLPSEEQTDETIGTFTLKQHGIHNTVTQTQVLNLEELDNSHVLDRLRSAVIQLHAETFGPGPHKAPKRAAGPKP